MVERKSGAYLTKHGRGARAFVSISDRRALCRFSPALRWNMPARALVAGLGAHGNGPPWPLRAPELCCTALGRIVMLAEDVKPNAEQVLGRAGFARCYRWGRG